jgi:hypothetical protein
MKINDDYNAKYLFWALDPKPQPEIPFPRLPKIAARRFSSYEEFNAWKQELLCQIAREVSTSGE